MTESSPGVESAHPRATVPRVALVTGSLVFGGATTFLCNLAGEFRRQQIPARIFSYEQNHPFKSDFEAQQIEIVMTDQTQCIYEDRVNHILHALRTFEPTVVVATLAPTAFETLRYLPAGLVRIGMIQAHYPELYSSLEPYTPWIDAMVGVSKEIVATLQRSKDFGKLPAYYAPYGVPMPPCPMPRQIREGPLRLIYLGRLERPQKRVHLFPQIFSELCQAGVEFVWTIAGEGPEQEFLMKSLGPETSKQRIRFAGRVLYSDVPALLEQQDIFLLASDSEGLPLSLLEAMGRGVIPVVSHVSSGVDEVIDPSCGILVPIEDYSGYARAIADLDRNRAKMAVMAATAQEKVRNHFSIPAMAEHWKKIIGHYQPATIVWPDRWKIQPIVGQQNKSLFFTPPVRVFRRWLKKFR